MKNDSLQGSERLLPTQEGSDKEPLQKYSWLSGIVKDICTIFTRSKTRRRSFKYKTKETTNEKIIEREITYYEEHSDTE